MSSSFFQLGFQPNNPSTFGASPRKSTVIEDERIKPITPNQGAENQHSYPNILPKQAADTVSFTKKAPATTEGISAPEKQSIEPFSTQQRRSLFAPFVAGCGALLGTVLGSVGGYSVADLLEDASKTTSTTTDSSATNTPHQKTPQTLDVIQQQPVYLKNAGEAVVLSPNQLTTPTTVEGSYYEFTPQAVQAGEPETRFEVIHHQPHQQAQIRYQYENPAPVVGATDPLKPVLKQINVLTPEGLNDCFTLDANGLLVSRVQTIQTDLGEIQNHEWTFAFDKNDANRTIERHVVYPATPNATGNGYHTATDAVAESKTLYEKIYNTATGYLQEFQVIHQDGTGQRLKLDPQCTVTECFEATTPIQAERLKTFFEAKIDASRSWWETATTDFKQGIQPDSPAEKIATVWHNWGLDTLFTEAKQWERSVANNFQDKLGVHKLTSKMETEKATMVDVALASVHPQTQLRNAIGQPLFAGGDPLLASVKVAWEQFKVTFNQTGGGHVQHSIGDRLSSLTDAFKQTSTGQKIGLGVGAVLGGGLGLWALLPKKSKKPNDTQ